MAKTRAIGSTRHAHRPPHVLTLTPFYPTRDDESYGCFVSEPLAKMAESGIQNSVLAVAPLHRGVVQPNAGVPQARWARYPTVPGKWGLSTAGALLFARIVALVRRMHSAQPIDILHAHAPLPCGHAAMLLSKELGIPYIVSVHGLDAYSDVQVSGWPGQWCRRVTQTVFRSASRVICVSEHVREQVTTGAGNVATAVVYNGVDPERFSPRPLQEPSQPIILSVANLIPTKGHSVLIRALGTIKDEHPEVACEIVGTGPEKENLQKLATQLNLGDRVRFFGRLSRNELAETFRRCTLFALPSFYEGLGCVYLEAMSSEKAAIGCRGQGIEEIIRHGSNGWLVEPQSSDNLAAGLSMLLSNPTTRSAIASNGRGTILHGLTLSHQAQRLIAIYREIAS